MELEWVWIQYFENNCKSLNAKSLYNGRKYLIKMKLKPKLTTLRLPNTTISSCLVHKAYIPYNHTVFKAQGIIGERDRSREGSFVNE